MQKKNILISVIDGQGGGIGRQYISALTSVLPKDLPVTIRALGTNSLATSNMLKGGANDGATGENAIVLNEDAPILSWALLLLLLPMPFLAN